MLQYLISLLDFSVDGQTYLAVSSVDRLLDIVKHTNYSAKQSQLLTSLGVCIE